VVTGFVQGCGFVKLFIQIQVLAGGGMEIMAMQNGGYKKCPCNQLPVLTKKGWPSEPMT
jgi:hypothetical protein